MHVDHRFQTSSAGQVDESKVETAADNAEMQMSDAVGEEQLARAIEGQENVPSEGLVDSELLVPTEGKDRV